MKVRFGSELTAQAVLTLRLLRDAFGVTFKLEQDRKKHRLAADLSAQKTDDDSQSESGSEGDEEMEEDGMGEDYDSDDGDQDREGDDDSSEGDDDKSHDSNEECDDAATGRNPSENSWRQGRDRLLQQSETYERSTILVSCLGTGYVNVNRKAT